MFFERKLSEMTGKPKKLWNVLKSPWFHNKISSCEFSPLEIDNTVVHDIN